MCSLCGTLGADEHWSDAHARPGVFAPHADGLARRRARMARVAAANRVLAHHGLHLADWQATGYLLSTRTGRTEIIDGLADLWPTAEAMLGRPCDPLDPALLEKLEAGQDG